MNKKWLYAVLILSLAVNGGALGFYGVKKYRDWRHFRNYIGKWFKPGTTRRQVDRLFTDVTKNRKPWCDSLRTATRELGQLAEESNPDTERVNAALDKIARSTRAQLWLLHENMRELRRLYRPEKSELLRKMVGAERDSILQADSTAAAGNGGRQ